jgi:hypothetical protein
MPKQLFKSKSEAFVFFTDLIAPYPIQAFLEFVHYAVSAFSGIGSAFVQALCLAI